MRARNCWRRAHWCRTIKKLIPSITRVFRKDQTMYVYFEVYDPAIDSDRKALSLTAEVDLMLGARKVYSSPPPRVSKPLATSRPGAAPFAFQIPLAKLPAGPICFAGKRVIDENGRKVRFPAERSCIAGAGEHCSRGSGTR